ncbi:hypothetical protein PG995_013307 [Apiospora arundinis]
MLLSVLIWAAPLLDWKNHGVQGRPATAAAVRRGDTNINWGSIRCPAANSLETLPTPTYPTEKGIFLVCTELVINASPQDVYHALFDFRAYPSWSSFVRDIALPPEVVKTPDDVRVGLVTRFTTTGIVPLINTTSVEIVTVMKGSFDMGRTTTTPVRIHRISWRRGATTTNCTARRRARSIRAFSWTAATARRYTRRMRRTLRGPARYFCYPSSRRCRSGTLNRDLI